MADHSFMSIPGFWLGGKFCPLIAGGSGEGEGEGGEEEGAAGTEDEGTEGSGSSGGSEGEGGGEGGSDDGAAGGGSSSADEVEALRKQISDLRKENAKRRTTSRDLETKLKAIGKALGVGGDDDLDADAVKSQLAKTSAQLKSLKVEQAIGRAARKHSADPDALTDSRNFMREAEELDPDDDNFASELDSLVEGAIKNNPKLKTSSKPGKSSGEFNDSSDGKKVSLDAAIAKGDHAAINKAFDAELAAGRK